MRSFLGTIVRLIRRVRASLETNNNARKARLEMVEMSLEMPDMSIENLKTLDGQQT